MPVIDDGDVVRGLGFVAMYAAHVEESIDDLLEAVSFVEPISPSLRRAQSSQKLKEIRRRVLLLPPSEFSGLLDVIRVCGELLNARHEVLHGRIYAQFSGQDVLEPGRPDRTKRPISSSELYDLANHLFTCRAELSRPLILALPRAHNAWTAT